MSWNKENFIAETSALFENPLHQKFVNACLPNSGDSLDKICSVGFAQTKENFDSLFNALTAEA